MSKAAFNDWHERDLSELIAVIESGQRPYGGATEESGEIPSLGGENIRQDGGIELSVIKKVPTEFYRAMTKGILQTQDVLINKDGANTGKAGLYDGLFPVATINEHLFLLRAKADSLTQQFLYRILISEAGQRRIRSKISGSAQPGLKTDFIRNFPVRIPYSTVEQSRIAVVLDTVDEAIAKTAAVIEKFKQIRAGLFHDLLTRGLDKHGQLRDPTTHPEYFQDSLLGRIPREWHVSTLEELTEPSAPICYGIVQGHDFVPNGVFVLAIRDILGDYSTGLHRTAPSIDESYARSRVRPGDVLISIKGTIGRIGLVPPHYIGNISRDLARLRPAKGVVPEFLMHLLRSPRGQRTLELAQVGSTRAELSIAPLKHLKFACPVEGEQHVIAQLLSDQDRLIAQYGRENQKVRQVKAGMITDLVTGRVRVPDTEKHVGATHASV